MSGQKDSWEDDTDMSPFELSESLGWFPPLPKAFHSDYELGNYSSEVIEKVMWKYLVRKQNCSRAWVRIHQHAPETLTSEPLDILELSTAHGAQLEIWRSLGHRVKGTDFNWAVEGSMAQSKPARQPWQRKLLANMQAVQHANPTAPLINGWPYQPLIESLGLDVSLHNGSNVPYPFEDKSFDYVFCYQALEAYGPPAEWGRFVDEFCRIARKRVVIGFNPIAVHKRDKDVYRQAEKDAHQDLMNYHRNGFRCEFFTMGVTRAGIHPTACKLTAVE